MGSFDSPPILLGELVQTMMSHPYHGHKNKQETGITLEVSNGRRKQVSDAAKCETDLAFDGFRHVQNRRRMQANQT